MGGPLGERIETQHLVQQRGLNGGFRQGFPCPFRGGQQGLILLGQGTVKAFTNPGGLVCLMTRQLRQGIQGPGFQLGILPLMERRIQLLELLGRVLDLAINRLRLSQRGFIAVCAPRCGQQTEQGDEGHQHLFQRSGPAEKYTRLAERDGGETAVIEGDDEVKDLERDDVFQFIITILYPKPTHTHSDTRKKAGERQLMLSGWNFVTRRYRSIVWEML
jgi:hypothetical protein